MELKKITILWKSNFWKIDDIAQTKDVRRSQDICLSKKY